MKSLSTYLLVMFMILFWIFRIVVTLMNELGQDFGGILPLNPTVEIILLFLVLLYIVLIVKRKMIGGILYLITYGLYFGTDLTNGITTILSADPTQPVAMGTYINTLICFIGIILPIAIVFDLLVDKRRSVNPKHNQTDWFYANKDFDRKMDDRADKNNYRTL